MKPQDQKPSRWSFETLGEPFKELVDRLMLHIAGGVNEGYIARKGGRTASLPGGYFGGHVGGCVAAGSHVRVRTTFEARGKYPACLVCRAGFLWTRTAAYREGGLCA